MSSSRALFKIGIAVLSLNSALLEGQIFQAQITGTVTDASGAVVPGAQIGAVNIANGSIFATKSNEAGIYRFPALPPGQYKVTCTMTGFQRFEESPVTVEVDQILNLDVSLRPGESTQEITVSASAATLDTESATLAQVVTTRSIQNLPLNVRDPFALMGLTPGVIFGPNFGNGGGQDVGRNYFKADVYIGGGRSGSNAILIDGAPDTLSDASKAVIDPPVDSVQEFAVQASSYNAQFGRTSGGVVNMVTKSGTNDFHGVVYDFERHSVLDANNFFNNRAGIPSRSFQRHQFGADGGGPIIKGKWFFFGDYEGLRQGYPLTSIDTLPTALQRQGNFSQTFATNGSLIQIYDPQTLMVLPDGTRQRSPFPGNLIPQNRINPTSAAVVQAYPQPNQPGTATFQNNYIYGNNSTTNSDKYDLRTDGNFSENNRAFFRYSREQDKRASPGNMPLPIGGGRFTTDHYTQAVTDFTHVFSASTVADVNVSLTRALAAQFGASQGFNLSSLNLPASFISQVAPQFPVYNISDVTGTGNTGDSFTQFQPRNVYSLLASVSHQRGKHSLKFGGAFMALHFNEGQNPTASGTYNIDRTFTQGPNPVQASNTGGYGFASFLLGTPTSGSIQEIQPISTYGLYSALYVHDDWKVSSRLTVNIGLRWDTTMGDREKYNRLAYFNPNVPSPLGPMAGLPNLNGLLSWVGKGNPKDQLATDWKDFAPRFGFAYSLDKKTVLRGGYGMFYMPHMVLGNGGGALEAVRTTPMVASLDGVTPANLINNPFPQGILPAANDRDPQANVGASITAPEHYFKNGYAQTWSMEVQRELPWGIIVDAHYWGNKGTRLMADGGASLNSETIGWNIDQIPVPYLALGSHLNDLVPNPFFGLISAGALSGPQISRMQSLLPFPQYTSVLNVYEPAGDSTYEAATIQGEKRLSATFTFLAAYTRSKAIDNVRAPLNSYDLSQEKGLSIFDSPNHFQLSMVYSVPFGRGRTYGKNLNPFLNAVIGNWDVNSIVMLQSGFPITIARPSVNIGQSAKLSSPGINEWFNKSVFTVAAPFTYGNVGPVLPDVRSDWARNIDGVLVKNLDFSVRERKITAQFRFEVFNVFNTPQFAAPSTSAAVTAGTFAVVTSTANSPRNLQMGLKFIF